MAKKPFRSYAKFIVFAMLSFLLSISLFVLSFGVVLEATVFNSSFIMDNMNSTNYFTDKKDEITTSLIDLGYASGLDEEFFNDIIDEVMLNEDTQAYLDSYYSGNSTAIDDTAFKQNFNSALDNYIEKKSIKNVNAGNRDYLVKQAAMIYKSSLSIPLFSRIAPYFNALKRVLPFVIGATLLFSAIICFVFVFTNRWKHRAVKYLTYATLGTFLAVGVVPIYVLVSGMINRINLESRALYNMVVQCSDSVFIALAFCALFFALISAGLLFWYKKLKTKAEKA